VKLLSEVEIKEGLKYCMEISSRANKYLQDSKFWEKENRDSGRYLFNYLELMWYSILRPTS
jgi:methionyl-tRNA synthetase